MTAWMRRRPRRDLVVLMSLGLLAGAWLAGAGRGAGTSVDAASTWTGAVDLYRSGAFTTQQSWLWCTAADVQIMRNLVRHETDHSSAAQRRSFTYMRAHNRYDIPVADGVDPAGWTAGLRHYVDARYRLVVSRSFDAALRSAVTNLRKTQRPVGLLVAHGSHAWVLTGFTATADPAVTTRFTITSVRVTGPLWGLQSRSYGYDMPPDTKLTPDQLRGFLTPWHYAGVRMAWEGRWVSIQPIPAQPSAPAPSGARMPTPPPSSQPSRPVASLSAAVASSFESTAPSPLEVALLGPTTPASSPSPGSSGPLAVGSSAVDVSLLIVITGMSVVALAAFASRRRRA